MSNNKKNNYSRNLGETFFEIIVEHRKRIREKEINEMMEDTKKREIEEEEPDKKDIKEWIHWTVHCSKEELNLASAMDEEVYWALYGLEYAYDRLELLYYENFDKHIYPKGKAQAFRLFHQIDELNIEQEKEYRSILIFYALQELYFWMGAVWDRMAQILNLFAFNIKNIFKNRDIWRNSFECFKDNYGDKDILVNDEDFKTIERLTNKIYQKIWDRRNILAHKGSLIGRVQAKSIENSEVRKLYEKFILGNKKWDFSNILNESKEFIDYCWDAYYALIIFIGTFLKWKNSQMKRE